MGRLTEFFDFINRPSNKFKDEHDNWVATYYWIEVGWDIKQARKRNLRGRYERQEEPPDWHHDSNFGPEGLRR
jgi:hypothetical protein|tara:strand:+ start:189 stop:407 length:219 start_codon:yes stop_codon:yes gene_type:complete